MAARKPAETSFALARWWFFFRLPLVHQESTAQRCGPWYCQSRVFTWPLYRYSHGGKQLLRRPYLRPCLRLTNEHLRLKRISQKNTFVFLCVTLLYGLAAMPWVFLANPVLGSARPTYTTRKSPCSCFRLSASSPSPCWYNPRQTTVPEAETVARAAVGAVVPKCRRK